MLNPDDLVQAWVDKLMAIQDLTEALGKPVEINGYVDRFPNQTNLRRAILAQPPGSILVVWMGVGPRRLRDALYFQHRFQLIVRAPEAIDGVSYGKIVWLIVNGIDGNDPSPLPLLNTRIHPACEPMDLDLPSAQRQSLLVSMDGETLDYFEFSASLMESGAGS